MKKKVIWSIVGVVLVGIIVTAIAVFSVLSEFPGPIKASQYQATTSGNKSTFHEGVIYRHPGMVPMLEVTGDYYEMGLQYGVLLRPEIRSSLESYSKILKWSADEAGIPHSVLIALAKYQGSQMASSLPQRFQDEIRGVSDGSGVPYDSIALISLFYDVSQSMSCSGVLMKADDGSIIHARNQDTATIGGEELGKLATIVRYNAKGYNSVIHMDYPIYLGVDTGYNDKGLCFSENTLRIRQPNENGFPVLYLIRMALEECSTIDQLRAFLDRHDIIGGSSILWSSRNEKFGFRTQLTPVAWCSTDMEGPILWDFNFIVCAELSEHNSAWNNLTNYNSDRENIASTFPKKSYYTIEDAVAFLRQQIGTDGSNYAWCGTRRPICHWNTQQFELFDPKGDGFYFGTGNYYASAQNIYHVYADFSKPPQLFMPAVPLDPLIEKVAIIENHLISKAEKLKKCIELANEYKDDANIQFIVCFKAFRLSQVDIFHEYAEKAYAMKPEVTEYKLYAGMAAYQQKEMDRSITLLENINPAKLSPEQDLYRLTVLERAYKTTDARKASEYNAQKLEILDKCSAHKYYVATMVPLIDKLE